MELEFNRTSSPDDIPGDDAVVSTLVDAVTNPNNTFNITVVPDSIQVIGKSTAALFLSLNDSRHCAGMFVPTLHKSLEFDVKVMSDFPLFTCLRT